MSNKLANSLVKSVINHVRKAGDHSAHEILEAVIQLAGLSIYTLAADKGVKLHALHQHFVEGLYSEVCRYEHDESYHHPLDGSPMIDVDSHEECGGSVH